MSSRLKSNESLPEGIKRIAHEEIESAETVLQRSAVAAQEP